MAEIYKGVKFELEQDINKIPYHKDLQLLKSWCDNFYKNNLAPQSSGGFAGNLSFRTTKGSDEFIITASGTELNNRMTDKDFVLVKKCNIKNNKVVARGTKKPSSETLLHYAIYKKFHKINAVFHGHSSKILSIGKEKNIPTTSKELPYGTTTLIDAVMEIIENEKFIIMKNHGFISIADNMNEAGLNVENL